MISLLNGLRYVRFSCLDKNTSEHQFQLLIIKTNSITIKNIFQFRLMQMRPKGMNSRQPILSHCRYIQTAFFLPALALRVATSICTCVATNTCSQHRQNMFSRVSSSTNTCVPSPGRGRGEEGVVHTSTVRLPCEPHQYLLPWVRTCPDSPACRALPWLGTTSSLPSDFRIRATHLLSFLVCRTSSDPISSSGGRPDFNQC